MKRKGKGKVIIGSIVIIVVIVLVIGGGISWSRLSREHEEARNIPIKAVDFSKLNDGTFIGEYEGGMYKWRANKVEVIVASGKVKEINLLDSAECKEKTTVPDSLYDQVIDAQSLQVDTVSGATLTSIAHLKSVENALAKAVKE